MSCFKPAVLVACAVLAGCSSAGGTGGGGTLTFTQFCGQLSEAVGSQLSTCFSGDKALWSKAFGGTLRCTDLANGIAAGRLAYEPASAQACLTATANGACTSLFGSSIPADCSKALVGKVAVAGTCYGDTECIEGTFCNLATSGGCSGTCKAKRAAGSTCGSMDQCVDGYYCNGTSCVLNPSGGTAELGAACNNTVLCKSGLLCDRLTSNCATPIKEGQSCVFGHGICEFFTSCGSANTCVRSAMAGGTCGQKTVGADYEIANCLEAFCKVPTGATEGTCTALVADMGVCGSDDQCVNEDCTMSKCAPRCVVP